MNPELAIKTLQQLLDGAVKGGLIQNAANVIALQQCLDYLKEVTNGGRLQGAGQPAAGDKKQ